MMESLTKYIAAVLGKKCNNPGTKSFDTIKQWVKDPLAVAKLSFFIFSASTVEGFLRFYQSDLPLIPFLGNNLEQLMRHLMKRVIKHDVMTSATNVLKLLNIDLSNKDHHRDYKSIDIGFVAGEQLKVVGRSVSERDVLEFRMQCKDFILALITKIKAKSPLNYSLVRNLQCLDPKVIATKPEDAVANFRRVLQSLVQSKKLNISKCDDILTQFNEFTTSDAVGFNFEKFSQGMDRIDTLYYDALGQEKKYLKLWEVVRKLLLLSHGQATVERSFSVNKDVSEQNISEHNLVARRIVKDHIHHVGGLRGVVITKELLNSAQSGRQRYHAYLEERKNEKEKKDKGEKRKPKEEEMVHLKKKKIRLEKYIKFLNKEADSLSLKAEETRNFNLIIKCNSHRKRSKDKEAEVEQLKTEIAEKEKVLMSM